MRASIAIAISSAVLVLLPAAFHSTNALFMQTTTEQSNQFAGATFSPTVAPVVTATANANNISLSWKPVTMTSGAVVSYVVMRSTAGATTVQVCTGVDAPTVQGTSMTCSDASAVNGVAYTYTEQPVVVSNGQTTWSLDPSVISNSVCLKKCK